MKIKMLLILLLGLSIELFAVVSDGTYDFSSFNTSGNNLVHNDFTLSGTHTNGTTMQMYKFGTLAYGQIGTDGICVYKISADGTNTGSFQLTGISAIEYDALSDNVNVSVVGNKTSGGTVQSDNIIAGVTSSQDTYSTATLGLTNFNGVQLTSFELRFDKESAGGSCANVDFNSFTISNAQAPSSNTPPTLTSFTTVIDTTNEDTEVELTLAQFQAQGDEADSDGTVVAFVVQAVSTGTLKIGTSSATATAYASTTNDTIDATHNAYWTPATNANGTLNSFTLKAQDNGGAESATAIQAQVSVTAVNDAPVINTVFNSISIVENNGTSSYDINISDIELSDLTLTIESNNTSILTVTPNWSGALDSSNWINSFNLTTVQNANGVVRITITVDDGELNTKKTFDINVTAIDYAPVLDAIADIDKNEDDSSFDVTLNASDSDGDTISYQATSSNSLIATVIENSGVLTITPLANQYGVVTIEVVASANNKSDTKSFKVNIASVNDAPTITINENITIDENQEQILSFSAIDVDGDNIAVTTTKEPQNGTVTRTDATITYTPYGDFSGSDHFILSFDDGNGGVVDKTIVVVVNPINSEVNITVATITKLFSSLKDTNVTVDKESGETTIIADSNVTTEIGFVYRAIVVIEKNGKAKTKIIRVNLVTLEETLIDFTLKSSLSYKEGNSIKISIKNGMLQIKITTKINTPLIIN